MDTLNKYRNIIKNKLKEYTEIPYAYGDLKCQLIISNDENNFLLITQGWEDDLRIHGCLVHLEIINQKIWIHRDGLEDGIASELVMAGIPKSDIVLAFHPPEVRQFTEFAIS